MMRAGVLERYRGIDEHVAFPGDWWVKEIGNGAFRRNERVKSVEVPSPVGRIGLYAFAGCGALESVTLPGSLREIADHAFRSCGSLKRVVIPEGVKKIGIGAFENCGALESVTLPESLEEIGAGAFGGCAALESVNLPRRLVRIGKRAFRDCTRLSLTETPECSPEFARSSFANTPPAAEKALRESARRHNGMDGARIVTVKSLRRHPNADRLLCADIGGHSVIVGEDCRVGQRLVWFAPGTELDEGYARENGLLHIPGRTGAESGGYLDPKRRIVRRIRLRGEESDGLALPIETLRGWTDTDALRAGDRFSVLNGRRLCSVAIDADGAFELRSGKLLRYRGGRERSTKVRIPYGTEEIAAGAFKHCRNLAEVILPDTVTHIGERAFYDCPNLRRAVVPESVGHIGKEAFAHCGSLAELTAPEGLKYWDRDAFTAEDFTVEKGTVLKYNGEMRDVVIPDGVTRIGHSAFHGKEIETVVIPEGVTEIGRHAFEKCRKLRKVTLPETVKLIGEEAFYVCPSLREVRVPAGAETIGRHAFGQRYVLRYVRGLKFPVEDVRNIVRFRIICAKGSAAERYARENGLSCDTE